MVLEVSSLPEKLGRHAATISALPDQVLSVGKYLQVYEKLFHDHPCWTRALEVLGNSEVISRSQLASVARQCTDGTLDWKVLFLVTMLWGFGDGDKAGSTKLFMSMQTPNSDQIIHDSARMVLTGQLTDALATIWKLNQCGYSYGTKWLFAVGTASTNSLKPVVLDRKVVDALRLLLGSEEAEKRYQVSSVGRSTTIKAAQAKAGYIRYCQDMNQWALALSPQCSAAQLERFLFESNKSFI